MWHRNKRGERKKTMCYICIGFTLFVGHRNGVWYYIYTREVITVSYKHWSLFDPNCSCIIPCILRESWILEYDHLLGLAWAIDGAKSLVLWNPFSFLLSSAATIAGSALPVCKAFFGRAASSPSPSCWWLEHLVLFDARSTSPSGRHQLSPLHCLPVPPSAKARWNKPASLQ